MSVEHETSFRLSIYIRCPSNAARKKITPVTGGLYVSSKITPRTQRTLFNGESYLRHRELKQTMECLLRVWSPWYTQLPKPLQLSWLSSPVGSSTETEWGVKLTFATMYSCCTLVFKEIIPMTSRTIRNDWLSFRQIYEDSQFHENMIK